MPKESLADYGLTIKGIKKDIESAHQELTANVKKQSKKDSLSKCYNYSN